MNILFTYNHYPDIHKGGVERVTSIIMSELNSIGYKCFFLLCHSGRIKKPILIYENQKISDLESFLIKNQIVCIINQSYNADFTKLYSKLKIKKIKYLCVFHDSPGSLLIGLKHHLLNKNKNIFTLFFDSICLCIYPIYYKYTQYIYKYELRTNYQYSDKYILLSQKFKQALLTELNISVSDKIKAIPNPLSFDYYYPVDKLPRKKKHILVVSRMEESQKRISEILYIWKRFNLLYNKALEWNLYIIGDGPDKKKYEQITQKLHLKNIYFKGRQNPIPYYEEASIFMMTSSHEGWGLTLTESLQYGLVPIAYNSYDSITDIIEHKYNGFLITNNDRELFTKQLSFLCENANTRIRMAENAIKSSQKFSKKNIIKEWDTLIQATINE